MFNFLRKLFGSNVDFKALVESGAVIIDVRSPEEYKSGHIKKSVNIPLPVFQGKLAELKKNGKPVITVCRSGARSGVAAGMLKGADIEAYNGGSWNGLESDLKI